MRGLLAITVVVHHFGLQAVSGFTLPYFRNGAGAVDVFFVLSGFLLGYAYLQDDGRVRGGRRAFAVSRIGRLAPAYLAALVISVPDLLDRYRGGQIDRLQVVGAIGATPTFLQGFVPGFQWWNNPAWSLSCEAVFYVLFAFVMVGLTRLRPATAAILAVLATLAPALLALAMERSGATHAVALVPDRDPLLRAAPFLGAALLGRHFARHPPGALHHPGLMQAGALGLLVVAFLTSDEIAPLWHLTVSAAALLAIWVLASTRGPLERVLASRPVFKVGEASYGIYIYQVGVLWLFERAVVPVGGPASFAAYLAVLVVGSLASVPLFERPARRLVEVHLGRAVGGVHRRLVVSS